MWLQTASDLLQEVVCNSGDDDDGVVQFASLPVCELDCADGELYYRVLGAWLVPWSRVPKSPFLAAWCALSDKRRRGLLNKYKAFAEELDVKHWQENLVKRDDVDMLEALPVAAFTRPFTANGVLRPFVVGGAVGCTRVLMDRDVDNIRQCRWWYAGVEVAKGGHLPMLQLLHERGDLFSTDDGLCTAAADHGHLACLRYLHENGYPWNYHAAARAAAAGQAACLRYALEHGCNKKNASVCEDAAYHGHLECLQIAHELGCYIEYALPQAANGGFLHCLKYVHEHGGRVTMEACRGAAQSGVLHCLVYLHEHGCPWDWRTCTEAATGGHLDCLAYAHEHGCPWTCATTSWAARKGRLACLQYAHEHGCPWNETACMYAIQYNNIDCLKYAHEHGCPWDRSAVLKNAGGIGRAHIRQWLLSVL